LGPTRLMRSSPSTELSDEVEDSTTKKERKRKPWGLICMCVTVCDFYTWCKKRWPQIAHSTTTTVTDSALDWHGTFTGHSLTILLNISGVFLMVSKTSSRSASQPPGRGSWPPCQEPLSWIGILQVWAYHIYTYMYIYTHVNLGVPQNEGKSYFARCRGCVPCLGFLCSKNTAPFKTYWLDWKKITFSNEVERETGRPQYASTDDPWNSPPPYFSSFSILTK